MPTNSKLKRDKRIAAARRMAASIVCLMGFNRNRNAGPKLNDKAFNEMMVRRDLIGRMTNWQRNQWGRAGYPQDIESLKHYMTLPHWKKARAA